MNPIYRFFLFTNDNVYSSWDNTTGKYIETTTGELLDSPQWTATGYLSVTPGSVLMGDPIRQTAFYDINRNYISGTIGLGNSAAQVIHINVPANAYYIRTSIRHGNAGELDNFYIYAGIQAAPTYNDDLAKDYEQETNQRFYRAKLSGKISFIGDDYDYLMSKAFQSQYILLIERSDNWGVTWVNEFSGKFFRTDCTINVDDKKITVQPDPVDEYNDTLAGIENEYNLIPLAPEIDRILMRKRPLIQVYIPGDSIVSCFLSGNYWEQDANATTSLSALVETYHFALANILKEMEVTVNGTPTAINGTYAGRLTFTSNNYYSGTLSPDTLNGYYITVTIQYFRPFFGAVNCRILRNSDNAIMFTYHTELDSSDTWDNLNFIMNANSSSGATGTATVEMTTYNIYARYLLDVESIDIGRDVLNTYPLTTNDIVDYNRNYRRAIGYEIDIAYVSNNYSTTPTEWGRRDDGTYFAPPGSYPGQNFYPIARSTWHYASIWFSFSSADNLLEKMGRKTYWLRDAYPIASVISVLLKQFAPDITHEATTEYSQFLYADTNPINRQSFWLYLTQKSNILIGDYQQPAQKAPTTLQQIMNMLRDVFKCYWYIEDGKFKIEHVQFFLNGGQYNGYPIVGTDTTAIKVIRNGKPWSFATSEYSFDKVDMPQRFQFKWMDDVTTAFEGQAIDVLSKYITPGKIEEINVSNFTSDVDMMMLNPGNMSTDGFGLLAAVNANALDEDDSEHPQWGGSYAPSGGLSTPTYKVRPELTGNVGYAKGTIRANTSGQYRAVFYNSAGNVISRHTIRNFNAGETEMNYPFNIPASATAFGYESITGAFTANTLAIEVPSVHELPFVNLNVDGVGYSLQNGLLAFMSLQPQFWLYDMPAWSLRVNGSQTTANSIERKKKQTLSFPMLTDPNPVQLIKTEIGSGQIDRMSINLCSRMSKTTVKYDTE